MQSTMALESSVLVLNKFFAAVHIVNAKRAFAMLFNERAEVVSVDDGQYNSYDFSSWVDVSAFKAEYGISDEDQYESIKTVSLEIRVPKIIRLVVYDKLPKATIKFNRKNIFARDNNRCQYCGRKFPTSGEPVKPRNCPIIQLKLGSNKYNSWKQFLDNAYWSVPLE